MKTHTILLHHNVSTTEVASDQIDANKSIGRHTWTSTTDLARERKK